MRHDLLPTHAKKFIDPVREAAHRLSLPQEVIWAVIAAESNFNPKARSPAGALGLMQLMPATAHELGVDPHDPRENIAGGATYLRRMLIRYRGNLTHALAAYNMGPARLGYPPRAPASWPRETQQYVTRVAKYLSAFVGRSA